MTVVLFDCWYIILILCAREQIKACSDEMSKLKESRIPGLYPAYTRPKKSGKSAGASRLRCRGAC